jgi:osmotically-inducible protein OsmY
MRSSLSIATAALLILLDPARATTAAARSVPAFYLAADTAAPKPDEDVRNEIQQHLAQEPQLKGLNITVKVDPRRIIMGGEVHTITQRDTALNIARTYSDGRQVIDDFHLTPRAAID